MQSRGGDSRNCICTSSGLSLDAIWNRSLVPGPNSGLLAMIHSPSSSQISAACIPTQQALHPCWVLLMLKLYITCLNFSMSGTLGTQPFDLIIKIHIGSNAIYFMCWQGCWLAHSESIKHVIWEGWNTWSYSGRDMAGKSHGILAICSVSQLHSRTSTHDRWCVCGEAGWPAWF